MCCLVFRGRVMPKDYYLILGVHRGASTSEIKQAYRSIAKKYHPDISRSQDDSDRFLEIKEAYETLVDETRRRQYNQEIGETSPGSDSSLGRAAGSHFSPGNEREMAFEWMDGLFERMFTAGGRRGQTVPRENTLYFEAILTPREAESGGRFTLTLPLCKPCWMCGPGRTGFMPLCPVCLGRGQTVVERSCSLELPAGLTRERRLEYRLPGQEGWEATLILLIRIDPTP